MSRRDKGSSGKSAKISERGRKGPCKGYSGTRKGEEIGVDAWPKSRDKELARKGLRKEQPRMTQASPPTQKKKRNSEAKEAADRDAPWKLKGLGH